MDPNKPIIQIPKVLSDVQMQYQTETLEVKQQHQKSFIGVPKESILQEKRVALVPSSVAILVANGYNVLVERGAGEKSNFKDIEYTEAGAELIDDKAAIFKAEIIIKAAPPTVQEIELMHPNQILISPLQLPTITEEYIQLLRQKRIVALAMEYIKDESGSFPIVRIMSEIAGLSAILTAAELMNNINGGKGVLLGGISGVPSAKVVILGAGVVGEFATRTALGLGAEVRIFDNNIYKLMRLQNMVGKQLYTSVLNPQYLKKELVSADVVIGAIHSKTGRTPMIVTEEMVAEMKEGAVIVDVSIDQGGCFATSEMTNHDHPTFTKHGVIHYCVPNIASRVAQTASIAASNILTSILLNADNPRNVEQLLYHFPGLRNGVYSYKGCLTNEYLGQRFGIKTTNIDLLLTSIF